MHIHRNVYIFVYQSKLTNKIIVVVFVVITQRARAIYSKPETEKASGASNELLKLMKNLSAQ